MLHDRPIGARLLGFRHEPKPLVVSPPRNLGSIETVQSYPRPEMSPLRAVIDLLDHGIWYLQTARVLLIHWVDALMNYYNYLDDSDADLEEQPRWNS